MMVDMARGKENPIKEGKLEEGGCRCRAPRGSSGSPKLFEVKEYT